MSIINILSIFISLNITAITAITAMSLLVIGDTHSSGVEQTEMHVAFLILVQD